MKNWPEKLQLFAVLSSAQTMISHSKADGWPDESPSEVEAVLNQIIETYFFDQSKDLPEYWRIQFAPTGPIQEIAIANGWHDTYMKLAEELDRLDYLLKEYKPNKPIQPTWLRSAADR